MVQKKKTKKKKSRSWLGWLIGGHFRRLRASATTEEKGMAMKNLVAPAAVAAPAPAPTPTTQATEKKDPLAVDWGDSSIAVAPALITVCNENYDPFRVDWGSRVSLHSVEKKAVASSRHRQTVQAEVHVPPVSTPVSASDGNPFGDESETEDICTPASASGNPFGDDCDTEEDHTAKDISCKLCVKRKI
jgi:hypothetical protein